jgi:cardiolipin synthase
MRTAADRIWITQAYFAPDEVFTQHINNAVARGVDVRLLVPGQSDSKLLLNASAPATASCSSTA